MSIKSKEYYEQLENEVESKIKDMNYIINQIKDMNYHINQAKRFKILYDITKNRKEISAKILNRFAKRMNRKHYNKGMSIAVKNLNNCLTNIDELKSYIDNEES